MASKHLLEDIFLSTAQESLFVIFGSTIKNTELDA